MASLNTKTRMLILVGILVFIAGLGGLSVLFAQASLSKPSDAQYIREHVFGVMSTDRLCERLLSSNYETRETALLAMKAYHSVMPVESARAMCEAILVGSIGSESREPELIRFHALKHRSTIQNQANKMLEEYKQTGSLTLCNGSVITPVPDQLQVLRDLVNMQ